MKRYPFVFMLLFCFCKFFATNTPFNQSNFENTFSVDKDTIGLIINYIEQSDYYKNKGLYTSAYGYLWDAMLLAESINDFEKLAFIHNELGTLYGIYGKGEKAIKHKQISLNFIKKDSLNKNKYRSLVSAYYGLAVQHRKVKNYDKSLRYLDSCLYHQKNVPKKNNEFVLAEKGNIFLLKNNLKLAEPLLLSAKQEMENRNSNYLVIVYSFLGDLYSKKNELDQAIHFYNKSLNLMSKVKSHTDLKTDILKKIGLLFKEKKQINKAYFYLEESSKIADSLFSARNKNNGGLLEIKNQYKETILKKDAFIKNQNLIIEKEKRIESQLILAIVFILFISASFVFLFLYRAKIKRLKIVKENTDLKIKHNQEKTKLILESKSKELTVSALKLIEKDKNIEKILEILKEKAPDEYNKIKRTILTGNKDLWNSFNLRFTELNTDFYKRLVDKHSTLTATEQKHCALIKLKFDSKEMARLLNISVSSVHISRHRIRKKMGLIKSQDLGNYIANI